MTSSTVHQEGGLSLAVAASPNPDLDLQNPPVGLLGGGDAKEERPATPITTAPFTSPTTELPPSQPAASQHVSSAPSSQPVASQMQEKSSAESGGLVAHHHDSAPPPASDQPIQPDPSAQSEQLPHQPAALPASPANHGVMTGTAMSPREPAIQAVDAPKPASQASAIPDAAPLTATPSIAANPELNAAPVEAPATPPAVPAAAHPRPGDAAHVLDSDIPMTDADGPSSLVASGPPTDMAPITLNTQLSNGLVPMNPPDNAHSLLQSPQHSFRMDPFSPPSVSTPNVMSASSSAYLMMALAQLSAGHHMSHQSPPSSTVTPAQVTLPNSRHPGQEALHDGSLFNPGGGSDNLESFARIEFADSVFQMTTYAVIIGRDKRAMDQARRDERRAEEYRKRVEECALRGLPPPSPARHDRGKFSKSYVSEEGGMLGPESDGDSNGRPAKRRRTSTAGSSQHEPEVAADLISDRQYVSHTPGAAAVDLDSLRPSPYHVPFIGIHSPGPGIASKTKAISREHLRIEFNQKKGVFEAIPLHKNGFFCEDVLYKDQSVVLRSGDQLQIKDVNFVFIINGVERGRTGAEDLEEEAAASSRRYSEGGKEMSFDFERSQGDGQAKYENEDSPGLETLRNELSDQSVAEGDELPGSDMEEDADDLRDIDSDLEPQPQPPKRRGPGRPPKDGIMSKRERRERKKRALEEERLRQAAPQPMEMISATSPSGETPLKRKVGRPRKHPLPEDANDRPEKRKYKPRKPKGEDGAEGSDAERRAKEKKEKKARPKSPPLVLHIDNYTSEQLQKPNKNYGVLIDETLTAAPDGLTLKQIYKRISQKYPWFYFHTETKGWESSVRHNLIGNEAFKKDETTGLWSRVPGVELDAGKKRKATSPSVERPLGAQGYGFPHPMYAQYQATGPNVAAPVSIAGTGGAAPSSAGHPQVYSQLPHAQGHAFHGQQSAAGVGVAAGGPARALYAQVPGMGAMATSHVAGVNPQTQQQQIPAVGPQPSHGFATTPGVAQQARDPQGTPHTYVSTQAPKPPSAGLVKTENGTQPTTSLPLPQAGVPTTPMVRTGVVQNATAPAHHHPPGHPAPQATPGPSTSGVATVSDAAATPQHSQLRPVIDPILLQLIVNLKNGLIENLKKAKCARAEAIVMSSVNRCIGLKTVASENETMEQICMKGVHQVLQGFREQHRAAAASNPDPQAFMDAKVLSTIGGFKNISVKTLKEKLGEARAEALTLSAIDRVLGLADASIAAATSTETAGAGVGGSSSPGGTPAGGPATEVGNMEGIEQHLMKSVRQLLVGMNYKAHGN